MSDFTSYGVVDPAPLKPFSEVSPQAKQGPLGSAFRQGPVDEPVQNTMIPVGEDNPTWIQSLEASVRENTLTGKLLNPFTYDDAHYNRDPSYKPDADLASLRTQRGTTLDPEEEAFLKKSVSKEDWDSRIAEWHRHTQDQRDASFHTSAALLGAVIDPIDAVAGAGLGKVAKVAEMGTLGRAGLGFGAGYTLSAVPESTNDTKDNIINAIGPMIGTMINFDKAVVKAADAKALAHEKAGLPVEVKPDDLVDIRPEFHPKSQNAKPSFTSDLLGGLKKFQSFYDEVSMLGNKSNELAKRVLGTPWDDATSAWSATAFQRNFMADAQRSMVVVEQAMTQQGLYSWHPNVSIRTALREERAAIGKEAQEYMHANWRLEREGGMPMPTEYIQNPKVRAVVEAVQNSNWSTELLRRAKEAGVEGASEVKASKNYMSIVWNYDRVRDLTFKMRGIGINDIATAFGKNITRQLGHFAHSDAEGMGMQFLKTMQGGKTGDLELKFHDWEFNGLNREELVATLRSMGKPEPEILRAVDDLFGNPNMNSVGDVTKSLRHRLDWDLDEVHYSGDGTPFRLSDFLEQDIHKVMERNTLEMTSRIGLARAGYYSGGEFQKALDEAADEAYKAGKSPKEVQDVLDHLRELALGRPIGENVPDYIRSASALGSAIALKNSGIYNLAAYAELAHNMGLKAVMQEFLPALSRSSLKSMTKQEGEELMDLITGRLVADGRFRPVVSYMEDNFEGAADSVHESIQYAAQSVRFLNGSEQIRRHQVKIFAGIYQKRLEAAIKGDKEAATFFHDSGISPGRLELIRRQFERHGWEMDKWQNKIAADDITTHALTLADSAVLSIRRGERPRLMESQLGKAIFPYMSFVFAAHNKILRRAYYKDGVTGVAQIMAYQLPLSILAASAANVASGKPWNDSMTSGVTKAMSSLGLGTIPADLITRGRMGGAFPGFAPVNSAAALISGPSSVQDTAKNIPFLATFLPTNLLIGALSDGKQPKKGHN